MTVVMEAGVDVVAGFFFSFYFGSQPRRRWSIVEQLTLFLDLDD